MREHEDEMSDISETLEFDAEVNISGEAAQKLYAALWQILDDMSEDGQSCCQAAKDQGINALRAAQGQPQLHFDWMDQ